MIRNLTFLNLTEICERFAYYGVRSILVWLMIRNVGMIKEDAISVYGMFTTATLLVSVFGGLIGDLLNNPFLVALIGNALTTTGIFMLSAASNSPTLFSGLILIGLGSGVYKPNIMNSLFRASYPERGKFDLIVSLFYMVINIGAFLAPIFIGPFGDRGNPSDLSAGFMVAGGASLIATVLLAVNYKNLVNNYLLPTNQSYSLDRIDALWIILTFISGIIFWVAYEYLPQYSNVSGTPNFSLLSTIVMFASAAIIIPLNLLKDFTPAYKLGLGLFLPGLALVCSAYDLLPGISGPMIVAACEFLVAPILMSQLMLRSSPRFAGTLIGFYMTVTIATNRISGELISNEAQEQTAFILGFVLVAFAAAFIVAERFRNSVAGHKTEL